ncbi:hypothetical protein ACMA1D_02030 [Streptomyces sp. 796.1]|uniref:hypothetical protein n=1 Tax=Streptomyces sp. 796.1 TaxID=3163029 RepID=UPI0039C8D37A
MTDRIHATPPEDTRRLVAIGTSRPVAGRRLTIRATPAGITGTSRPAQPSPALAAAPNANIQTVLQDLNATIPHLRGVSLANALELRTRLQTEQHRRAVTR